MAIHLNLVNYANLILIIYTFLQRIEIRTVYTDPSPLSLLIINLG